MDILDRLSNPYQRPFGLPTPDWMQQPAQQPQYQQMPDFGRMANMLGASEIGAGITPWQLQSQWGQVAGMPDARRRLFAMNNPIMAMLYRGMF